MPDAIIAAGDYSSQARYLFDRFTGAEGIANIRALVGQTPRVFETNWLEFKGGKAQLATDEHLKTLWSKALGLFANSGGGILIWGIRADRDPATGIDAVQAEEPVPDVEKLAARLREYQPPATDPPIKGVIVHPMLLPGETKSGFVVCYIPESDSKPHRSEWGKNDVKRFNIRIGDTTQECTLPILRQLFYPTYTPKLEVSLERLDPRGREYASEEHRYQPGSPHRVLFSLKNAGSQTLDDVRVWLRFGSATLLLLVQGNEVKQVVGSFFLCKSLHPSLYSEEEFYVNLPRSEEASPENWEISVFARHMEPKHGTIRHLDLFAQPWMPITVACI